MTIKTIKFKNTNNLEPEKEREVKGLIIALALFAAGMIVGAGILRNISYESVEFSSIFDEYIVMRTNQKAYQIFFNSLFMNLACLILASTSGLSCVGIPLSVIIPVIKGFGNGFLAGYLFSEFTISGIGYYLLTILPGAAIANTAILLACNNACFMSADILAIVLSKKQTSESLIKSYIKKSLIIILFSAIASVLDSILVKSFAYLFSF